jgi:hypothetical protein
MAGRLAIMLLMLAAAAPARGETAHSLSQVPRHLKTPEARSFFAEQIEGKPAPDGLGTRLPPGLTATGIATLLAPPADRGAVRSTGARKWRGDLYVAIACTGAAGSGYVTCTRSDPPSQEHAYLGVVAIAPGAAPRVIATAGDAFAVSTPWGENAGLPGAPADSDGGDAIPPQSITRFDLAPYRIAPGTTAFGLRVAWDEGYSGGGAEFTGLDLFAIDGTRLRPVLAVPMSASIDLAGDWHPDGTRDHHLSAGSNIVVVTRHLTAGYYDLIVRSRHGGWQRRYRWSPVAGAYRPASG